MVVSTLENASHVLTLSQAFPLLEAITGFTAKVILSLLGGGSLLKVVNYGAEQ